VSMASISLSRAGAAKPANRAAASSRDLCCKGQKACVAGLRELEQALPGIGR
jgi:hypothetical protein